MRHFSALGVHLFTAEPSELEACQYQYFKRLNDNVEGWLHERNLWLSFKHNQSYDGYRLATRDPDAALQLKLRFC